MTVSIATSASEGWGVVGFGAGVVEWLWGGGVGVARRGDDGGGAVVVGGVVPAGFVAEEVVGFAVGAAVVVGGFSVVGAGDDVVDFGEFCWAVAAGLEAFAVAGFDVSGQ